MVWAMTELLLADPPAERRIRRLKNPYLPS
jgi:hypothetical protein